MCIVPDLETLETGHVRTSTAAAGSEFDVGTNVTLDCDEAWRFTEGSTSKLFHCVARETVSPDWEYCTGMCY